MGRSFAGSSQNPPQEGHQDPKSAAQNPSIPTSSSPSDSGDGSWRGNAAGGLSKEAQVGDIAQNPSESDSVSLTMVSSQSSLGSCDRRGDGGRGNAAGSDTREAQTASGNPKPVAPPPSQSSPGSGDRRRDSEKGDAVGDSTIEAEMAATASRDPNRVWREPSHGFRREGDRFDWSTSQPPSPSSSSKPPRAPASPNHDGQLTPREFRVSFRDEGTAPPQRSRRFGSGEEVLFCSGNGSFRRRSSLTRMRTKSRLMDPPETEQRSTQRMPKPSVSGGDNDEEDPFLEDDLPDEYRKLKYNKWTLLQLISLILIVAVLACSLSIPYFRHKNLFDLELWKWELMILVLISGRLVSGWAIRLSVFLVERNFLLRKRVLYFVYGSKKAVQNCVWLGLVLLAWQCIFDKKVEHTAYGRKVLPLVTKVWVCLLVGTVFWLVKTLLVKVLASSFHVSAFFDRIQESLFNQYVIETLSAPPLAAEELVAEEVGTEVFKSRRLLGIPMGGKRRRVLETVDEGITIDHLHRLNQKNVSAWNMKRLMNIVRNGVWSTLDEQLQGLVGVDDEVSVQITSENQAKVAAKKIFCNVAEPGSKHIFFEDLMRLMREDESLKTIRLFDGESETKGISKRALKNWVVNVFRERRALALSLDDTKTAVNKLHQMMNIVVGIITVVIWLLILKVTTTNFLIFLSSQLLLVVFVFGNTCKTTFEAIIFLFVMHPFDVGDRCEVDGVQMIVEEMNILTTIFLRYDNQKILYPNSVLSNMPIANYYRSPDMGDAIDFCIHVSTPAEKVAKMKERITSYVENKNEHWYPDPMIVLRDVEDLNRLKISIWLSHRMNFQDMGERWRRRALLIEEMIKIFKDLDVEYRMLPFDINVRNMPSLASTRLPSTWTTSIN